MTDNLEYRQFWVGGLVCPNPTEYYRMTRSYEQMRAEYDLLHCNEVTEEDILKVVLANGIKGLYDRLFSSPRPI